MVKLALNNTSGKPFVEIIGRFIANFGTIEKTIIDLGCALTSDPVWIKKFKRSLFAKRIEILTDQLRASELDAPIKEELLNHLEKLEPFRKLRNIISHNPLGFSFPDDDPTKPATVSGIVNMRPKDTSIEGELIGFDELNGGVNATAKLIRLLHDDLNKVQTFLNNIDSQ